MKTPCSLLLAGLMAICALTAIAPVEAASAQEARPPADQPVGEMSPAEVQRLFDAYVIVQAQERLELSEGQYAQFLTRLKGLQETRRRNQQSRAQLIQDLNRLTNPRAPQTGDETVVRERLKALQDTENRAYADIRKAYDALDQVLDVRQQARFRVFEDQMERRKLELLFRARQANRPRQVR